LILLALLLWACADTDPYRRAEPAMTRDLTREEAARAFNDRWPRQFKAVQTVTLDFRVETRTLVGYLVIQRPDKFRLQGMTEHGLNLFDLVGDAQGDHIVSAVEEFNEGVLSDVARDIRTVFLLEEATGLYDGSGGDAGKIHWGEAVHIEPDDEGTWVRFRVRPQHTDAWVVDDPPLVDWYEHHPIPGRTPLRVNHYEWGDRFGRALPDIVVVRNPGLRLGGARYKLTICTTQLDVRDEPWPDAVFNVDGG
jgi:hypothetical protein